MEMQKSCNSLIRQMTLSPEGTMSMQKLQALLNEDSSAFLALCRKTMYEMTSGETNLDGSLSNKNQYDKLVHILHIARTEIPLMADSPDINKNIVSKFGKILFDALMDPNEILQNCVSSRIMQGGKPSNGLGNYKHKICMIARCLAWLLRRPANLSIEQFKEFEAKFQTTMETGLHPIYYKHFKKLVLIKYWCTQRSKLATQKDSNEGESCKMSSKRRKQN